MENTEIRLVVKPAVFILYLYTAGLNGLQNFYRRLNQSCRGESIRKMKPT
jgi:hypothetical protein